MRINVLIKRIIIYLFVLILAFILQTSIFPQISLISVSPNLLLFIVYSYGLMYGSNVGMLSGLFAGLLMDQFYSGPFGFFMLVFTYIGFFAGCLSIHFQDDSVIIPIVLCVGSELVYGFSMIAYRYFTTSRVDIMFSLRHLILPETLFTLIITLVFYRLFLFINKKMDKIDKLRGKNLA